MIDGVFSLAPLHQLFPHDKAADIKGRVGARDNHKDIPPGPADVIGRLRLFRPDDLYPSMGTPHQWNHWQRASQVWIQVECLCHSELCTLLIAVDGGHGLPFGYAQAVDSLVELDHLNGHCLSRS